jgi:hypothetical protein
MSNPCYHACIKPVKGSGSTNSTCLQPCIFKRTVEVFFTDVDRLEGHKIIPRSGFASSYPMYVSKKKFPVC